jgi:3,4-dihydroxy-9,10-secoandrosta-1,3,5(10)-triene-9,17-dione 4,5-dioxygenase
MNEESTMGLVSSLGYVVISAEDVEAWGVFAQRCLGLQARVEPDITGSGNDVLYLRLDERSWRIAVEQGRDGGLIALGFEMFSSEALQTLRIRLEAAGLVVKDAPELALQRDVLSLVTTTDPSGVPLEFFYGGKGAVSQFVSPQGVEFVTGDQGMGHAAVYVTDEDKSLAFYTETLGFRLSDVVVLENIRNYFTSPNSRHHALAFLSVPGTGVGLEHFMLQTSDLDHVGRALDRCLDAGIPISEGLGKHTNDHTVSFYCVSPSGLTIEYGWNARSIDDSTHVTGYYDAANYWGHRPLPRTS